LHIDPAHAHPHLRRHFEQLHAHAADRRPRRVRPE
jgi:hypothetical protein